MATIQQIETNRLKTQSTDSRRASVESQDPVDSRGTKAGNACRGTKAGRASRRGYVESQDPVPTCGKKAVSDRQIEANRLNAKKSTGPKTKEGKARSSINAITHGLTSRRPILADENKNEFDQFANDFIAFLGPVNPIEEFLCRRISSLGWRLQRASMYETLILENIYNTRIADAPDTDTDEAIFGRIITDDFRQQRTLEKVQRYESQIDRAFFRHMKELDRYRAGRLFNYSDIKEYLRGYIPKDPFFNDEKQNESNSTDATTDSQRAYVAQQDPVDPRGTEADRVCQNEPNSETEDHRACVAQQNPVDSRGTNVVVDHSIDNQQSRIENPNPCYNAFKDYCKAFKQQNATLSDEDKDPNFTFKDGWHHRVLNLVHYPLNKRKGLSEPELVELADSVLLQLANPKKFLRDFGLISEPNRPIIPARIEPPKPQQLTAAAS